MTNSARSNEGQPAPLEHQEAVRELRDRLGEQGAADALRMPRSAIARIVSGAGLRTVTRELLAERLGRATS